MHTPGAALVVADSCRRRPSARAWIEAFRAVVPRPVAEELNDLDRRGGDGDFGTNLTSALRGSAALAARGARRTPADVFAAVSAAFMETRVAPAGRCSACGFASSRGRRPARPGLGVDALAAAAERQASPPYSGSAGAQVGDKTMVDAMVPAAEALAARGRDRNRRRALAGAAQAARAGADSTADLVARARPRELRRRGGARHPRPGRGHRRAVLRGGRVQTRAASVRHASSGSGSSASGTPPRVTTRRQTWFAPASRCSCRRAAILSSGPHA